MDGLLKDPLIYQGVDPALLGRTHQLVLGKHSGRKAVQASYARLGITLDNQLAGELLTGIRHWSTQHKQPPGDYQLLSLYHAALNNTDTPVLPQAQSFLPSCT